MVTLAPFPITSFGGISMQYFQGQSNRIDMFQMERTGCGLLRWDKLFWRSYCLLQEAGFASTSTRWTKQ